MLRWFYEVEIDVHGPNGRDGNGKWEVLVTAIDCSWVFLSLRFHMPFISHH